MNLKDIKAKLEFDKIINRIRKNCYSDLGLSECDGIDFFTDENLLNLELNRVLEMKEMINSFGYLSLDGLKDIRKSLNKINIEGYFITPEEYLHIFDFLKISRIIRKNIDEYNREDRDRFGLLWSLAANLFYDKILEHNIDITVDETGQIRDTASSEIKRIRREINSHTERLRRTITGLLKDFKEKDYSQEDIITQRDGRFVIPVKAENKRKVHGIIHGSSSTGATVFIEPVEVINLNNAITELRFDEKREIEKILRELAEQLKPNIEYLKLNCEILSELDFLQAKARYAIETISEKPQLGSSNIKLIKAYHPVLLQTHKREEIVPLNLTFGEEFNTLVISGPNAGGKTVALKTIGLLQLMLQSGILIPAKPESEFPVFMKIFISIGDEQSIENDLSTFSSHLQSIKEILDHADNSSLILIDEIASGTDPVLGSALSSSILKYLNSVNSLSVVTTHNTRLKEFAFRTEGIQNASLEFDNETLSPNFKFITGVPGQSFTFEIAKKFNFPQDILDDAKTFLDENESKLEDLLKELNIMKQDYTLFKNKYDVENARLTGLVKLYEQKVNDLKKNEKVLKAKAKIEAENIIKEANKIIEKTVKEIREEKASPKEIRKEFQRYSEELLKPVADEEPEIVQEEINTGDIVRIKGSDSSGEVIEIDDNNILLNVNGISVKAKLRDLEKIKRKDAKREHSKDVSYQINDKPLRFSLDLRGKYTDEIQNLLEEFIHESNMNGLKEVSIIHGKGSGKLREEVKKQLISNSLVKSFRHGNWNEGDLGVTVVEL
jgi:DNA mismatch repair protein MutS2